MGLFDPPSNQPLYDAMAMIILLESLNRTNQSDAIPFCGFGGWIIRKKDGAVFGNNGVMALFNDEREATSYKDNHLPEEWSVIRVDVIYPEPK